MDERKKKIIDVLNKARSMELHGIHQYMNQHYSLDDADYGELAKNIKLIAIDEMRHAENLAERIKELGGEPTTVSADKVTTGQTPKEAFNFDNKLEEDTIENYNQFLLICRENGDSISVKLFEKLIKEEQEHCNYFGNIASHIENLGNTYLARIAGTSASTGASAKGFVVAE